MDVIAFIGGLGLPELFIIFCVILLLFGAKKIPELAKSLGKATGEFKKAKDVFHDAIDELDQVDEPKQEAKIAPPITEEELVKQKETANDDVEKNN